VELETPRSLPPGMHPFLRIATPSDGEQLAGIYRPAVTDGATSFELDPPDGEEMGRRVRAVVPTLPWLVLEVAGTLLGYAYAAPHRDRPAYRWSVDVSAYVAAEARRHGVARRLYDVLLPVLALQGYRNAYAGIALPNEASLRFHEALGFTPVGTYRKVGWKHGAWHDVTWYERALAGHEPEPPEPQPLGGVLERILVEEGG
jgi:L-amino acid N-acyltransferase YncA